MKRVSIKIVALLLVGLFLLTGCKEKESEKQIENQNVEKVNYQKAIVIYFSRAGENYSVGRVDVGNTAMMASYIIDYLKCDSFEILPKEPYSDSYDEAKKRANKELNNNARPEMANEITNLDEYDTVFLGYPIWCGNLPMIMNTFMEKYDLSNKTIIPFNTHEGSGNAGTYKTIKNKLTSSNVIEKGLYLSGKVARSEDGKKQTIEWLKSLGY